jgi:hypothetical protein
VARQGDFDPHGDGIIGRADCYLLINGTKEHSIHARFFGDAEKCLQQGTAVRGFNDIQGWDPAQVRAARMIDELPEPTSPQSIHLQTFCNIYGAKVDAEQALEVTAQAYMMYMGLLNTTPVLRGAN